MICAFACSCSKKTTTPPVVPPTPPVVTGTNDVELWVTTGSQSTLLQKQAGVLSFGTVANASPDINVDSA